MSAKRDVSMLRRQERREYLISEIKRLNGVARSELRRDRPDIAKANLLAQGGMIIELAADISTEDLDGP